MHSAAYSWKFSRFTYTYVYRHIERTYSGGLVAVLIKPAEMDRNIRVLIDTAAWHRYFGPFLYFLKEKATPPDINTAAVKINSSHRERKPHRHVPISSGSFISFQFFSHIKKFLFRKSWRVSLPLSETNELQHVQSFGYINEFTAQLIGRHNP